MTPPRWVVVVLTVIFLAAAGVVLWTLVASPEPSTPPAAERPVPTARATQPSPLGSPQPSAQSSAQSSARPSAPAPSVPPSAAPSTAPPAPLRSVTIALDPGHQLGNAAHPAETNALVPAGGSSKPCNTTGTATDAGVAEATVNFQLAQAVAQRLRALGAVVKMTRTADSRQQWGPCIDERGRFGQRVGAQLMVSLHADGAGPSDQGFHVIAPVARAPWTDDIAAPSLRLATALRDSLTASGVPRSNYTAGGSGLNLRSDLGTLNLSDVPVAMIEIGNMRNSGDAQRMTSSSGQATHATAIVRGIRAYLGK